MNLDFLLIFFIILVLSFQNTKVENDFDILKYIKFFYYTKINVF